MQRFLICLAFLLPFASTPLPNAGAQTITPPPLSVTTCEMAGRVHAFEIVFHNTGTQAMRSVTFNVMTESGPLWILKYDGDYAPGSESRRREWASLQYEHYQAGFRCLPAAITYADGTTWRDPSLALDIEKSFEQTPGANIAITDCRAMDTETGYPDLHFAYRNDSEKPVTKVTIGFVEHGAVVFQKEEEHTFAPGELNTRDEYGEGVIPSDLMHQKCIVLNATYGDGTTWTNPSPPPTAKWPPIAASATSTGGQLTLTDCDSFANAGTGSVHIANSGPLDVKAWDIAFVVNGNIIRTLQEIHTLKPQDELTSRGYTITKGNSHDAVCVPLRVQYTDGTQWINPLLQ